MSNNNSVTENKKREKKCLFFTLYLSYLGLNTSNSLSFYFIKFLASFDVLDISILFFLKKKGQKVIRDWGNGKRDKASHSADPNSNQQHQLWSLSIAKGHSSVLLGVAPKPINKYTYIKFSKD